MQYFLGNILPTLLEIFCPPPHAKRDTPLKGITLHSFIILKKPWLISQKRLHKRSCINHVDNFLTLSPFMDILQKSPFEWWIHTWFMYDPAYDSWVFFFYCNKIFEAILFLQQRKQPFQNSWSQTYFFTIWVSF